jgi:hypothetical protein
MSDSDPEGDILNFNEILKNCKNANIKKKIKQVFCKEPPTLKLKKKKGENKSKNLRKTCPSNIKSNRSSSVSLERDKTLTKTTFQDKKELFSTKWKEKRN